MTQTEPMAPHKLISFPLALIFLCCLSSCLLLFFYTYTSSLSSSGPPSHSFFPPLPFPAFFPSFLPSLPSLDLKSVCAAKLPAHHVYFIECVWTRPLKAKHIFLVWFRGHCSFGRAGRFIWNEWYSRGCVARLPDFNQDQYCVKTSAPSATGRHETLQAAAA